MTRWLSAGSRVVPIWRASCLGLPGMPGMKWFFGSLQPTHDAAPARPLARVFKPGPDGCTKTVSTPTCLLCCGRTLRTLIRTLRTKFILRRLGKSDYQDKAHQIT